MISIGTKDVSLMSLMLKLEFYNWRFLKAKNRRQHRVTLTFSVYLSTKAQNKNNQKRISIFFYILSIFAKMSREGALWIGGVSSLFTETNL